MPMSEPSSSESLESMLSGPGSSAALISLGWAYGNYDDYTPEVEAMIERAIYMHSPGHLFWNSCFFIVPDSGNLG